MKLGENPKVREVNPSVASVTGMKVLIKFTTPPARAPFSYKVDIEHSRTYRVQLLETMGKDRVIFASSGSEITRDGVVICSKRYPRGVPKYQSMSGL